MLNKELALKIKDDIDKNNLDEFYSKEKSSEDSDCS
jgi:hypothetical protein